MKHTADFQRTLRYSHIGNVSVDTNGGFIDCLGYQEALAILGVATFTGTDPQVDVKWQETVVDPAVPGQPLASGWADIVGAAHQRVESHLANLVASVNVAASQTLTLLLAGVPPNPARMLITLVDTTPSVTQGSVTITGFRYPDDGGEQAVYGANGDVPVTEVVQFTGAATKRTNTVFKSITSAKTGVVAGVAGTLAFTVLGGAGDETIKIGSDNAGKEVPHIGSINLVNRKRFLRAVTTKGGTTPVAEILAGLVLHGSYRPALHLVPREFRVL